PPRQRARVEKTAPIDVCEVHDDAELLAAADHVGTERGEPLGTAAAAVSGIAGFVGAEVAEAEIPHTAAREPIEGAELPLERMRALDSEKRGDGAARLRDANVVASPRFSERF